MALMEEILKEKVLVNTAVDKRLTNKYSDICLSLEIPFTLVKVYVELKTKNKELSYLSLLNSSLPSFVQVKADCKRIEKKLKKLCYDIPALFRRSRGGTETKKLNERVFRLAVYRYEVVDVAHVLKEITELRAENEHLEKRCSDLYSDLLKAKTEREKVEFQFESLKSQNQNLFNTIKFIEEKDLHNANKCSLICNPRKKDVGQRQRNRQIKQLKSNVDKALWFAKSFGLQLDSVKLHEQYGQTVKLDYTETNGNGGTYDKLSEQEKEKIRSILYIMDRFCIGDASYHEFTYISDDLPKSYLIKQCRQKMNECYFIERTPGWEEGVQLSFKAELESQIAFHNLATKSKQPIRVKISGDGAKMSRITNFLIISFSFLDSENNVDGEIFPIAIIKASESYEVFRRCLRDLICEINEVIENGSILVGGNSVAVYLFLGADYKFILLIMGFAGATSNHSCIWCKIEKDQRWDTTKPLDFYSSSNMIRSLDDIVRMLE
ncbi:uncharacterized protein [Ptychodera flava]|uniref:uncharacterized protein n=1 Tax=Ptychodera flava TaxID=63121 RepID=UPI00396A5876